MKFVMVNEWLWLCLMAMTVVEHGGDSEKGNRDGVSNDDMGGVSGHNAVDIVKGDR